MPQVLLSIAVIAVEAIYNLFEEFKSERHINFIPKILFHREEKKPVFFAIKTEIRTHLL